jgi:hypothetical protein
MLITQSPETFKGGGIWLIIQSINGSMKAIGYGLLVLFTAIGLFGSTLSFRDFQRPEHALRHFIRFVAAKTAVTYCMDVMTTIFTICGGVAASMSGNLGNINSLTMTLPGSIQSDIADVGFFASIPLWLVTFVGALLITVLSFVLIMTVYGRFFKLYIYTAVAPLSLSTFAGENTSSHGKAFLKSYVGVCLEGAVIILACIIFSAMTSSGTPGLSASGEVVTRVWSYLGETVFNMLLLVGLVKGSDRLVKEMFGL